MQSASPAQIFFKLPFVRRHISINFLKVHDVLCVGGFSALFFPQWMGSGHRAAMTRPAFSGPFSEFSTSPLLGHINVRTHLINGRARRPARVENDAVAESASSAALMGLALTSVSKCGCANGIKKRSSTRILPGSGSI
jgi:hypothetical protein